MKSNLLARRFPLLATILIVVYALGLSRDLREPWIGLHDWNGAFFSLLARNCLRYPFSMHHGMPVVAVGAATPSPAEASYYPRHPPGLVWALAAVFDAIGESEATARCLPIAASLVSLWLLTWLVRRRDGETAALLAGGMFALMPMTVYFGRMVNHEPLCLLCMLGTLAADEAAGDSGASAPRRRFLIVVGCLAITAGIWVDWAGGLFAFLFVLRSVLMSRRDMSRRVQAAMFAGVALIATAALLCYLTSYGLEGRWLNLWAIFADRQGSVAGVGPTAVWGHLSSNLGWPIVALCLVGVLRSCLGDAKPVSQSRLVDTIHEPLGVITLTAILWVLLLWRQFQLHPYWMYYLAPGIAVLGSNGVRLLFERTTGKSSRAALAMSGFVCLLVVSGSLIASNELFARITCPVEQVDAWKRVARFTRPDERVVLSWDPHASERHGTYVFRNIVPAQLACYMDRAFDVASPAEIPLLVKRGRTAILLASQLAALTDTKDLGIVPDRIGKYGPFLILRGS